jgi:hypothetical protein
VKRFVIATVIYFAFIGAMALLPLLFIEKKEHKLTVMEEGKFYPLDEAPHWVSLPPDKHREVLEDIIEEVMADNETLRTIINECKCREK